jgi:hypothetical protein
MLVATIKSPTVAIEKPPTLWEGGKEMDSVVVSLSGKYQGGKEMIGFDWWVEVKGLHKQGWSIRKIARELGMDCGTVRKVLRQDRPEPCRRTARKPSILAPFTDFLRRRAPEVDYCAQRLFLELRELGYKCISQTS